MRFFCPENLITVVFLDFFRLYSIMVHGVNLGVTVKYVLLSMTMYRRQMDFCAVHLCLPNGFFTLDSPANNWDVYLTFRSQYSDSLRPARSGDRIPVEARFSAPIQNGPEGHPCFYTMDTRSLSRLERCRGMKLTSHSLSSVEVKQKMELYLYSISGPSWPVPG